MKQSDLSKPTRRICIVSPLSPPYGGVTIQAEKLIDRLRGENISVAVVKANVDFPSLLRPISKIKGVRTALNFVLFLMSLLNAVPRVDIVHHMACSHLYFFLITTPTILLSKLFRKRIIINYRGGEAEAFFNRWGFLARRVLALGDRIIVPSEFLREVFYRFGMEAKIVPNIVDLESFSFVQRDTFRPRLINTRHLEKLYNIECTLRAFKLIQQRYGDAELAIVGSGPERERLERFVRDHRLRNVIFYGHVPHTALPKLYNDYDIFINSSNADNLPGSLLEAAACGLPIVSTNAGGIPYLIKEGITGLLVGVNDDRALADKVSYLLENQQRAHELAKNAFLECRKYAWEDVYKKLKEIYCAGESTPSVASPEVTSKTL